jgi:hypothetical protein
VKSSRDAVLTVLSSTFSGSVDRDRSPLRPKNSYVWANSRNGEDFQEAVVIAGNGDAAIVDALTVTVRLAKGEALRVLHVHQKATVTS